MNKIQLFNFGGRLMCKKERLDPYRWAIPRKPCAKMLAQLRYPSACWVNLATLV